MQWAIVLNDALKKKVAFVSENERKYYDDWMIVLCIDMGKKEAFKLVHKVKCNNDRKLCTKNWIGMTSLKLQRFKLKYMKRI